MRICTLIDFNRLGEDHPRIPTRKSRRDLRPRNQVTLAIDANNRFSPLFGRHPKGRSERLLMKRAALFQE